MPMGLEPCASRVKTEKDIEEYLFPQGFFPTAFAPFILDEKNEFRDTHGLNMYSVVSELQNEIFKKEATDDVDDEKIGYSIEQTYSGGPGFIYKTTIQRCLIRKNEMVSTPIWRIKKTHKFCPQ
jgi:hypothetical protein